MASTASVSNQDGYRKVSRQLNFAVRALGIWVAIVSLFFLLQALDYSGLIARLAEWQFLLFDSYWPTLTFVAVTGLFTAPLIFVIWLLRKRQKRDESLGAARLDDRRVLIGRLHRLQGFFAGISIGSLVAVIVALLMIFFLPGDSGTPRSLIMGSADALSPVEGPTILTGEVNLAETAQFNENLFLVKRTLYFAPVRSGLDGSLELDDGSGLNDTSGLIDRRPIRFFVEVRRDDVRGTYNAIKFPEGIDRVHGWRYRMRNLSLTPYMQGTLRKDALPGEIANLYRYAGYEVADQTYVLFSSRAKLTWRYYVLAGEFFLAVLIFGILAILFGRRRRGLLRKSDEELAAG